MLFLLENLGRVWETSGIQVEWGGQTREVPGSEYKYFIPKECMYVNGEWEGCGLAL